jgi:hypothetical protein
MRVSREKRIATPPIRHVRVDLGRGEVRVAKHLLNAPEIGSSLQEMRGEGMAQEMRVNPGWIEAGLLRQLPQDQERTCSG